jgi:hypothetical protein
MSTYKVPPEFTYAADSAADLSSSASLIAKIDTSGKIALCGDGQKPIGVIIEGAAANYPSSVQIGGIMLVKLGGTVTAGDKVSSGASGVGNTATSGDHVLGVALESGVSGDYIPVACAPGYVA